MTAIRNSKTRLPASVRTKIQVPLPGCFKGPGKNSGTIAIS